MNISTSAVLIALVLFLILRYLVAFAALMMVLRYCMIHEILSNDQMSENACRLMKESVNCRIRLKKADAKRKEKSSRPTPAKLWQLLSSLLKIVVQTIVSAIVKALVGGFWG